MIDKMVDQVVVGFGGSQQVVAGAGGEHLVIPADTRQFILIELRDCQQILTVRNLSAQDAVGLLTWAQHHELHEIENAEHAHS